MRTSPIIRLQRTNAVMVLVIFTKPQAKQQPERYNCVVILKQ